VIESQDVRLLMESPRYLHAFADRVVDDVIPVEEKRLLVTAVARTATAGRPG
jgi:hypothetical protein